MLPNAVAMSRAAASRLRRRWPTLNGVFFTGSLPRQLPKLQTFATGHALYLGFFGKKVLRYFYETRRSSIARPALSAGRGTRPATPSQRARSARSRRRANG